MNQALVQTSKMNEPKRQAETDSGSSSAGGDERLLLRRFQAGEPQAFEALYRQYVGKVHGFALRLTGNTGEAEELTQETFVRAWQNRNHFESPAHYRSWLFRVVSNLRIGEVRSARFRSEADESGDDEAMSPSGDKSAKSASSAGLRVDLERALAKLPVRFRAVLLLFYVHGLRHGEIAKALGITEGTSRIHLHRARQRLREVMS